MKQKENRIEMEDFDAFAGIFVAQKERPIHLQDIDFRELTSFERAWLVIDGTVTRFLEAQKMEPIDIVECGRSKEILRKDHVWLEVPKGSIVNSRRVLLRGGHSGHIHASAASLVVPERVKEAVGRPVDRIPEGLGRMLLSGRTEQFRELLWYGKEMPSDLPGEIRSLASEWCLSRTYRIIVEKKPVMLITEWFELGSKSQRASD